MPENGQETHKIATEPQDKRHSERRPQTGGTLKGVVGKLQEVGIPGFRRSRKARQAGEETGAQVLVASQWRLMWWKFRKHQLAKFAGAVLILFYLVAGFCEFVSPHDPHRLNTEYIHAPPQKVRFFDVEGAYHVRPFVYRHVQQRDPVTLRLTYHEDRSRRFPIRFLVAGDPYALWGWLPMQRHLIGLEDGERLFLLGADRMGRDLLSRIAYGARVSLSIGLIGIAISFVLGLIMGGISGYFGGRIDDVIQRLIEFIMGIPGLPLWMTLSAALVPTPSVLHVAGLAADPVRHYPGAEVISLPLDDAGMQRLVDFIDASFKRDGKDRAAATGPGLYPSSRFYPAVGRFHILNTCNTWTARALKAAGFDVGPDTTRAEGLMRQVRRKRTPTLR